MNQETFRSDFKHIVWLKGKLTDANNHIRQMSRYDRNGSHKTAIMVAIQARDEKKQDLEKALQGKTYDEWKRVSKKFSYLTSKLIKSIEQKDILQSEIHRLFDKQNETL